MKGDLLLVVCWNQDITLFKSVGVAFQDIATARAVLQKAEEAGAGVCIDM